jgi:ankyrin repeat protein
MIGNQPMHPSSSLSDLPEEILSPIWAAGGGPLDTCKATAAISFTPSFIATWLLSGGHPTALITAARHKQWQACLLILASKPKRRRYALAHTLAMAVVDGQLEVVTELMNQGAWAEWAWSRDGADVPQDQPLSKLWSDSLRQGYATVEEVRIVKRLEHPLVTAAKGGQADMCSLFLEKGDVGLRHMHLALCAAANQGHLSIMQLLLGLDVALSEPGTGASSVLCEACEGGHLHVVQFLLDFGADADNKAGTQWSYTRATKARVHRETCPLLAAAHNGSPAVLQLLTDMGATLTSCWHECLAAASGEGHLEAVQWLLGVAESMPEGGPWQGQQEFQAYCQHHQLPSDPHVITPTAALTTWQDLGRMAWQDYGSPLLSTSYRGHAQVVHALLDCGQNCGDQQAALAAATGEGHLAVMQLLIAHGTDVNGHSREAPEKLPLAVAIGAGQLAALELLLEAGAEATPSALVTAAQHSQGAEMVELLLQHGASDTGDKALVAAAIHRTQPWPVVQLLLESGHGVVAADSVAGGHSYLSRRVGVALVAAAGQGTLRIVEHLLRYQPQDTAGNSSGRFVRECDVHQALVFAKPKSAGCSTYVHPDHAMAQWQPPNAQQIQALPVIVERLTEYLHAGEHPQAGVTVPVPQPAAPQPANSAPQSGMGQPGVDVMQTSGDSGSVFAIGPLPNVPQQRLPGQEPGNATASNDAGRSMRSIQGP